MTLFCRHSETKALFGRRIQNLTHIKTGFFAQSNTWAQNDVIRIDKSNLRIHLFIFGIQLI